MRSLEAESGCPLYLEKMCIPSTKAGTDLLRRCVTGNRTTISMMRIDALFYTTSLTGSMMDDRAGRW